MISIVVPVYNVGKYLSQCLDSILAQTYKDFEVILVNDGSSDNSGVICNKYAELDTRIKVIHQQNLGVSVARNNGIESAKGEWINFIDSDDWVNPYYLEKFNPDNCDADVIVQGLELYNHRLGHFFKRIHVKDVFLNASNFKAEVESNDLLSSGYPFAKLFKKSLLGSDIRFNKSISFHEDHIFVLDVLLKAKKIALIDSCEYKYRCYHTDNSLSSKKHSWNKMNLAGDEMLNRIQNMRDRFYDGGSEYEKRILSFAYSCKMDAAVFIILSDSTYCQKRSDFKKVIIPTQLATCYYPQTFRSKLTKFIYMYLPFSIAYLYHKCIELLKRLK